MRYFSFKQQRSRIVTVIVLSSTIIIFAEETRETFALDLAQQFRPEDEPLRRQQAAESPYVPAQHASMSVQPPANGNTGVWFAGEDGTLSAFPLPPAAARHRRIG